MNEDGLPDFFGKVVFVQPPTEGHSIVLVDARFERQGGKWILVGKPIDDGKPHWTDGATIGFQWKYVAYYAVFDSVEQFEASWRKAAQASEEPKSRRGGWLGKLRGLSYLLVFATFVGITRADPIPNLKAPSTTWLVSATWRV